MPFARNRNLFDARPLTRAFLLVLCFGVAAAGFLSGCVERWIAVPSARVTGFLVRGLGMTVRRTDEQTKTQARLDRRFAPDAPLGLRSRGQPPGTCPLVPRCGSAHASRHRATCYSSAMGAARLVLLMARSKQTSTASRLPSTPHTPNNRFSETHSRGYEFTEPRLRGSSLNSYARCQPFVTALENTFSTETSAVARERSKSETLGHAPMRSPNTFYPATVSP